MQSVEEVAPVEDFPYLLLMESGNVTLLAYHCVHQHRSSAEPQCLEFLLGFHDKHFLLNNPLRD